MMAVLLKFFLQSRQNCSNVYSYGDIIDMKADILITPPPMPN